MSKFDINYYYNNLIVFIDKKIYARNKRMALRFSLNQLYHNGNAKLNFDTVRVFTI